MQEFLTTLVSFPTFMFTCALVTTLLYWMVVIFGALDSDFLDSVLGLDSMDGAVDGALDAGADGAAEGVEGAESEHGGGLLAGLLNAMGVRGVPITIVGTFVIFWAWILSYLSTRFLGAIGATLIVGLAIVVTSSFGALFMAAISSRPFRKLFVTQQAQRRASLVGKMCTVLSARVDGKFGRAEIEDGGAGFVAEVRCPQENGLIRGAQALVYR